MEEMTQAIDAISSPAVQMWMNWMLAIFAISLVFVWKHVGARYALGAFILSYLLGYVIFTFTSELHLTGIAHIILWLPLAVYLFKTVVKSEGFKLLSPYGVWVALLLLTIVISLAFDFRDVAVTLMGRQ